MLTHFYNLYKKVSSWWSGDNKIMSQLSLINNKTDLRYQSLKYNKTKIDILIIYMLAERLLNTAQTITKKLQPTQASISQFCSADMILLKNNNTNFVLADCNLKNMLFW